MFVPAFSDLTPIAQHRRWQGFRVLGYNTVWTETRGDKRGNGKRAIQVKHQELADDAKYPGPTLRRLRKERGVGKVRKYDCDTCQDTGHCMGAALYPSGHTEIETYCPDCAPLKLRGRPYG